MATCTRLRTCLAALTAAFALIAIAAHAAADQPSLSRFTQADGLASDFITHLYLGRSGLLWVGTHSGLSRFDGRRFVSYYTSHGLPHPTVRQVLETSDGHLWVATDGGLARLEPHAEDGVARFRAWTFGSGAERVVSGLTEDSRGHLWFGSGDSVVRAVVEEDGRVRFQRLRPHPSPPALPGRVLAITKGPQEDVWIATAAGLIRVQPDGRQRIHLSTSRAMRRLRFDAAGTLWATDRNVVLAFRPETSSSTNIDWAARYAAAEAAPDPDCRVREVGDLCLYTHPDPLPFLRTLNLVPDGTNVWIAGIEGLARFDGDSFEPVGAGHPWLQNRVETVLRDAAGSLWIGTWTGGLLRLPPAGIVNFLPANGLRSQHLVQVLETPAGESVAVTGTNDDFWLHVLTRNGRFRAFRPRGLELQWNGWGWNQWVVLDHQGEWWIPSEGDGIYRYPAVLRAEELATTEPAAHYTVENGLPGDRIFRIYEDGNGDIWLGLLGGHGAVVWERSSNRFHAIGPSHGLPDAATTSGPPSAFAEDGAGRLWMGFYNGGIARAHDSRNREFELLGEADGLPVGFVNDLFADAKGRLWIATTSALARVDDPSAARPRIARLTARDGVPMGRGCCFAEDAFGRVYVGTERGISRLHAESRSWTRFTTGDGLASNLLRTMHSASNGDVWLGTRHGLSRLTSEEVRPSSPPPVRIEEVRVAGEPRPVPPLGATALTGLVLRPEQHRLTVAYFGVALEPGETLRYQHRLRGSRSAVSTRRHRQDSWSAPSDEVSVTFEALPAGAFLFEVRAVRGDGTASAEPATLEFARQPPVWRRSWFAVLAAAILALVAWGLVALRHGRRRALERQRERIARDLHDQLGSGLGSIGIVAELLAQEETTLRDGHEPAREIAAAAHELGGSLSDIVWALDPQRLSLEELAARLAQRGTALLSGNSVDLICRFPERWPETKPSAAVRRSVLLIGLEALHNAARHADPGRVELLFEPDSRRSRWRLVVRDDGCGLPFGVDRRRTASRRVAGERRRGRGLESMRRRAEEIGARIAWHPTPGGGTTVELDFPLQRGSRLPWRLT